MTDPIESPERFWDHLRSHVLRYDASHGLDFVLPLIRARDAAVRREALREAAALLSTDVELEYATPRDRNTWLLSRLSCAARIAALATKEPSDG